MPKDDQTEAFFTQELILLTIPQVMNILGVGRTRLYELIKREKLPVVRIGPGAVRIKLDSLQNWIQDRERMGWSD